jgi:iron-sulfur cluster repair protein YtfE (RIC family)
MSITEIPESVREEHEEIFSGLRRLAYMDDGTGKAVRSLLELLEPHFEKEDEIAMPLLGAVAYISKGKKLRGLDEVISLQGRLAEGLPSMLAEHQVIGKRIANAKESAKKEKNTEALSLLAGLEHHAKMEEEVLYPSAMLAGIAARAIKEAISA